MATTAQLVTELYIGYLGRAADSGGLAYWVDAVDRGLITLDRVRTNFVFEQPEYAAVYGGLTRAQTVEKIYTNLFERPFDAEGFEYWVNGDGSVVPEDNLIAAFLAAAAPTSTDRAVLDSKVEIALGYTQIAGSTHYHPSSATAIVADVNHDPATEQAAATLLVTAQQYLESGGGNGAPFIGMMQSTPGVPDTVDVSGRVGQEDIYLLNTFNFDRSGDTLRFTNFERGDQLFLNDAFITRVGAPTSGVDSTLEVFLEQAGADVRMSVETTPLGANAAGSDQLVTVIIVGATVDEIIPA